MQMSHQKGALNEALQARIDQFQNIYRLGALRLDGWIYASDPRLEVHAKWELYKRSSCLHYPIRNKCERICSKGLILTAPKVFQGQEQEALEEFWSKKVPQTFLKDVYPYCATVGWCCATVAPDPKFGARPVCVPPTTPGLMLRWNEIGDVEAKLERDDAYEVFHSSSSGSARGLISKVFNPLLGARTGALGVVMTSSGAASAAASDPNASSNAFNLSNIRPGFYFGPPCELVFISLSPWNPDHYGVITPLDSIMSNIEFWEETKQHWMSMLRERTKRPIVIAKPMQHSGNGKNDPLHGVDFTRAEMPDCKDKGEDPRETEAKMRRERESLETRQAAFVASRWTNLINYHGKDPYAVLPPSMGGKAVFRGSSSYEKRLRDGEIVQRTDPFPDLPDATQISAHLNEEACQSYGVPMSLGSRSSDSGQAKLWSTGGDEQAFRMYQQTCEQDSVELCDIVKKMYVKCMGPNHVVSSAVYKVFQEEQQKAQAAQANHTSEERDADGDTPMGNNNGDSETLPKGQKELIRRDFKEETEKDGATNEQRLEALRKFEASVKVVLMGNIEMADVQTAADGGSMTYENYRQFLSANTHIPLSMLEKTLIDPFRLKVAEKEADIDANSKAKAKAKTATAGGSKKSTSK
jgi:hypothetical protein